MQYVDGIIKHASELVTVRDASLSPKTGVALLELGIVRDGAVAIHEGKFAAVGPSSEILESYSADNVLDATDKVILPGLIDPHTHLVFGNLARSAYELKIRGKSYSDIHKAGAGIHYTVQRTREASKDELIKKALKDLDICLAHGTTTIEIKSGYGLDRDNEIKVLEIIQQLNNLHDIGILGTYMGAHTVPVEFQDHREAYVRLVCSLLPEIAERQLADFCDVFCDDLGFSVMETRRILEQAGKHGFKLKLHAEQTGYLGGVELASELGAISADHLDYVCEPQKDEEGYTLTLEHLENMAAAGVIGVLLPGVTYHSMELVPDGNVMKDFLPQTVRNIIATGVAPALATNYNPGSSPTRSMPTIMQLAARLYRMNYAEIIIAATINAAHALGVAGQTGSIEPGKQADLVVFDCPRHGDIIEQFGTNLVDSVLIKGKPVVMDGRVLKR